MRPYSTIVCGLKIGGRSVVSDIVIALLSCRSCGNVTTESTGLKILVYDISHLRFSFRRMRFAWVSPGVVCGMTHWEVDSTNTVRGTLRYVK